MKLLTICKKNFIKHYKIFLLYILPPLLIFASILLTTPSPFVIVPNPKIKFTPYCDTIEKGNSEINIFHADSSIVFGYTLKEGFPYPYAGISIDSSEYINLSRYNRFVITHKTSSTKSFRLFVLTFEDSITKPKVSLSNRYNELQIPSQKYLRTYNFKFSDLSTPSWWFERNKILPNQYRQADFSKVTAINLNNGYSIDLNKSDTLTVTRMKFIHSNQTSFVYSGIAFLCYYIILLIISRKKRKPGILSNMPVQVIPYEKIDVQSCSNEELNKVISFLATNFSDPDLSVQKTAETLKLSVYKVPSIIKEHFNCSFKEYLNKIRIEEAKRLLSNTDRRVTEIVFAIGYNSPPHFNRLFKEMTGQSPREFREYLQRK
jgi:AraC-like DNA-binding protein